MKAEIRIGKSGYTNDMGDPIRVLMYGPVAYDNYIDNYVYFMEQFTAIILGYAPPVEL